MESTVSALIVTTVLNGANWLPAALDSVAGQSWPHWRHVIIDAGSTDGSIAIVKERAERDSRIVLCVRPGVKFYPALLDGFDQRLPQDKILSWLNADDRYTPWALDLVAQQFAGLRPQDECWVSGLPAVRDQHGRIFSVLPRGWNARNLIAGGWHHDEALGCLQQESIFFSAGLYARLTDAERSDIRRSELAGDFVMWRAFARHVPLRLIPSVLGAFTITGHNRSIRSRLAYQQEVYAAGGRRLPAWLIAPLRRIHTVIGSVAASKAAQRALLRFAASGHAPLGTD